MTMPDERFRAANMAREFLLDLTSSTRTPRVPKDLRQRALGILRHYPSHYDFVVAAQTTPDVFQEKMDPLIKLMTIYSKE